MTIYCVHLQYGWGIIQHLYFLYCEMVHSLLLRRQFLILSAHSWQFIVRNLLLEGDVTAKGRNVIIKTVNMITQNYCHKQHHNSIMNSTHSGLALHTFSLSAFLLFSTWVDFLNRYVWKLWAWSLQYNVVINWWKAGMLQLWFIGVYTADITPDLVAYLKRDWIDWCMQNCRFSWVGWSYTCVTALNSVYIDACLFGVTT